MSSIIILLSRSQKNGIKIFIYEYFFLNLLNHLRFQKRFDRSLTLSDALRGNLHVWSPFLGCTFHWVSSHHNLDPWLDHARPGRPQQFPDLRPPFHDNVQQ